MTDKAITLVSRGMADCPSAIIFFLMTLETEALRILPQKRFLLRAMGIMAGQTLSLAHGFMDTARILVPSLIMAGGAEHFRCLDQNGIIITGMHSMAHGAGVLLIWCVGDKGGPGVLIVAVETKRFNIFTDLKAPAGQPVTGAACSIKDRLMHFLLEESGGAGTMGRMAANARCLHGEISMGFREISLTGIMAGETKGVLILG